MTLQNLGRRSVRFRDPKLRGDPDSEYRVGDVEVWVDIDALARSLGPRALLARGMESREASGAVVVRQVV